MKSTFKLLLFIIVAALLSVAASCSTSTDGVQPGTGNGSTGGGVTCGEGLMDCNGVCVDTTSNPSHCGGCGMACGVGQDCQVAQCRCQGTLEACGAGCANTNADPLNCGGCGMACSGATPVCNRRVCSATCDAGLTNCNNSCTNPASDPFNCGTCGVVCGSGQLCQTGTCICADGTPVCNGVCTDTMSDAANCGGCGVACGVGQSCMGGVCSGAASVTTTGTTTTASTSTTGGQTTTTGAGGSTGTSTTSTSTTGSNGNTPPGWWSYAPLNWGGCAWTGIDTEDGTTTTVVPQDFTAHTASEPYCVQGTVHNTYESVALLGFDLAADPSTANCAYDPAKSMQAGPPGIQLDGTGIAVNFSKTIASTLRVQIQGPDGATDAGDRWCASITEVSGKVFVPFSEFNTECWEGGNGVAYNNEPISSVVFLVPGTPSFTDYNFCINGFATGNSADDAPDGGGGDQTLMGTIGGGMGDDDLDFQRVKVKAGGKSYIIQNNNWGNPAGTNQTLSYVNNSFTITQETGGEPGGGAPASFPSIYIGANGDTQDGVFSTSSDDNLPKQVSTITSIPTKFAYNRASGDYNATYDVWFSAQIPTTQYDDGISGFLMIWLYKPANHHPIGWGSARATGVSLAGHNWDVYVGDRGNGSGAQVISYIATSPVMSMDFDLMTFINHSVQNNYGIQSSWYLTDVFGGFEIWTGSGTNGLSVTEFTAVVN